MDKIVVVIVDKQALFRIGARHALSQQSDFEVFDYTPNEDSVRQIEANSPDVLLLDIDYPSFKGLDLARKIALHCPTIKIIILTYQPNDYQLLELIKIGVAAYLDKGITTVELVRAVRQVSCGRYLINDSVLSSPMLARHVLGQFQNPYGNNGENLEAIIAHLTSREIQILTYIADGNSNKQIAYTLQISEQTIKNHVSNILRKLNANDRAHAVVLAIRHGWISAEKLT